MFEVPYTVLQYTNYLLLIWFLVALYRGYKRGMILQLVDMVTTFVSLLAAWILSPIFQGIYSFVDSSSNGFVSIAQLIGVQTNRLIWFVLLFVAIRIVLLVVKPLATLISKMPLISQVNSSIGGVFSVAYFIVKMIILVYILGTPIIVNGQQIIDTSMLKHVQAISKPVVETVFASVSKNEALQSIILEQKLTDEQSIAITEWLQENGFTNNEIKEFLNKYE